MKRTIFLILCSCLFTFCNGYGQPKLEVSGGNVHDWGTVTIKDSPLKTDLVIKNAGTGTLFIYDVHPTCGCTTAPVSKKELGAGDTTIVHLTMTVSSASGYVSKALKIKTNDTTTPELYYTLKANVYRPLEVKPTASYFSFNDLFINENATAKLFIKNTTKKPITIRLDDYSPKGTDKDAGIFKVNLNTPVTIKAGEEFELIGVYKSFKLGQISGFAKIKTDCEDMPEILLYTYGTTKESAIFNGN